MTLLTLFGIYLVIGLVFALAFIARGYRVIDPVASGAGLPVRLLWVPAATLLWPLLFRKWLAAGRRAPTQE